MEEWADWLKKETAAWKEEEHAWKKFEYTPPEQPRELILKLGQKITDRIGHTGDSRRSGILWIRSTCDG